MAVLQSDGVNHTSDLILRRNGTEGLRLTSSTVQVSSINDGPLAGFRNAIINGDMRIDQRNSGESVSISSAANTYFVDRWRANAFGGGVFSVQRSAIAPDTFTNSIVATVTTADTSVASGDFYHIRQSIEGFNFSNFAFGTASAQAVSVSFWVRSSVTGTYTLTMRNNAGNRGYVTTYTINSANTWEKKSITIPGDTSGTWTTDNTSSAILNFNLGHGNTQTANSWSSSAFEGVTGMTQWISTNGATFYVTGVQLEAGPVATPFERRPFGTEFALCQRYFEFVPLRAQLGLNQAIMASIIATGYYKQAKRAATPIIILSAPQPGITFNVDRNFLEGCAVSAEFSTLQQFSLLDMSFTSSSEL